MTRRRRGPALALSGALLGLGCTDFALWVEPPPPPRAEAPVPPPFRGKQAPALERTEHAALLRAPSLSAGLYFYEPDGLWYRRWRGRWYQAFTWDGHWFPPRRVPDVLRETEARAAEPQAETTPAPAP
jgi:hypothetical protein